MIHTKSTALKVASFAVVMVLLTVALFFIFGQYRTGDTNGYSAVFRDASRLKSGDSVRVAGVRVGTVDGVTLRPDNSVLVDFDADRDVVLTTGTTAAARYLNLTGDRYLDLADGPGSTRILPPDGQIPIERTSPALDLDLLLGGLKPVIRGLNPQDVNALTSSLLQVLQGQDTTLESLFAKTSSFANNVADNDQAIQEVIQNLSAVMGTLSQQRDQFSGTLDRLEKLISGLAADKDPIAVKANVASTFFMGVASYKTYHTLYVGQPAIGFNERQSCHPATAVPGRNTGELFR